MSEERVKKIFIKRRLEHGNGVFKSEDVQEACHHCVLNDVQLLLQERSAIVDIIKAFMDGLTYDLENEQVEIQQASVFDTLYSILQIFKDSNIQLELI